jgi:hypothetical protein
MAENNVISISKCEIEFLEGKKPYSGKPMSDRKLPGEQTGELQTFRVTSSDELNLIVGLIEWPDAPPELVPLDLLGGLDKHNELARRGRISLGITADGNWLVPLSVLKFNPSMGKFTLQRASEDEIDELLGHSFRELMIELGAIDIGSRQKIDGETNNRANQFAMIVKPQDIESLAVAYVVTRALAVIKDFGVE